MMKGGGPPAWQGLAKNKLKHRQYRAGARGQFKFSLSLILNIQDIKLILCQCLKAVRQFEAKTAAILLDKVLDMELRGGIRVAAIQHVVNAG